MQLGAVGSGDPYGMAGQWREAADGLAEWGQEWPSVTLGLKADYLSLALWSWQCVNSLSLSFFHSQASNKNCFLRLWQDFLG